MLTPQIVLDEAKNLGHPLHSQFDWDDASAAEAHRRDQAQKLIRTVKVVYRPADDKSEAKSVRAWQPVRTDRGHEYRPTEEVSTDPFLRQMVLADMQRDWQTLKRRYEYFTEFSEMVRRDLGEQAS